MSQQQINNPLHGITLKTIVNSLVDQLGWEELAFRVDIRCFKNEPSVNSSLKFLRKTPWARKMVEDLYLKVLENGRDDDSPSDDRPNDDTPNRKE